MNLPLLHALSAERLWKTCSLPIWRALTTQPNAAPLDKHWQHICDGAPIALKKELADIPPERANAAFLTYLTGLNGETPSLDAQSPFKECGHATPYDVILHCGGMRLLYYPPKKTVRGAKPFFLVPSLINKSYIMDFCDKGLVATLTANGFPCYLADFSAPVNEERRFACEDYVLRRLLPAAHCALRHSGGAPMFLCGYCMGGLLAVGLSRFLPRKKVAGLALYGMPWDFARIAPAFRDILKTTTEKLAQHAEPVPGVWVSALFYSLFWPSVVRRRRKTEADPQASRLETWLNDGLDLAAPVALETVSDWLGKNAPKRGKWTIGAHAIVPRRLPFPTWICAGKRDAVVPAISSLPALKQFREARLCMYPGGHAGMMTNNAAAARCRRALMAWARG